MYPNMMRAKNLNNFQASWNNKKYTVGISPRKSMAVKPA